jgi:anti-sigma factor RsiW
MPRNLHCAQRREQIHGYLDDALSEVETRELADHLEQCGGCRTDVAQLRRLQAALRGLQPPGDSTSARDRVFARYRGSERSEPLREVASAALPSAGGHWWRRHPLASYALAAAAAIVVAFLPPVSPVVHTSPVLPGPAEMSVLSERHDLHVAHAESAPETAAPGNRPEGGANE